MTESQQRLPRSAAELPAAAQMAELAGVDIMRGIAEGRLPVV